VVALCEMVERLAASEGVDGIAGCVTASRLQQGTPAPRPLLRDLDVLPRPVRPSEPYLVAGVPIAFCITTRGCHGDCNYCCINAFTRDAGGPRYRLRHAEEVAGEFAELAQRGVQALFLQDDLFVLPSEQAALRRFAELQRACRQKDVPPLVLWIKGRPESITVPVLEAAQELGALHIFLGIENASPERLRYLGRTHGPQDAERALALCGQVGMHASFNVMLFDPESTLEQVEENFDFLERHAEHPWNVCRTEIYPGTHLFERLQREGRLLGDFRSWGYRMSDPRAELLFRILRVSLLDRAFAATSLLNRLISLAFAWQLHSRLFPGVESEAVAAQAQRLGREAREDTVQMLRRAAEWVRQWPEESLLGGQDAHFNRELSRFAAAEGLRAAQRDFPRHQLAERLWDWLHARGAHHQRTAQRGAARPLHPGL